jgi:GTP cyclohydrolase I
MSFDKTKLNPILGKEIYDRLTSLGIEAPTTELLNRPNKEKIEKIEDHMAQVLRILGLDLDNEEFSETPNRIAKMWVNEFTWGYLPENFPKCTAYESKRQRGQMVMCESIQIMSNCGHHAVTIDGLCSIAYIPKEKVLGLSKLNRIAEYYSRRFTTQEYLTDQIFESIKYITETDDVAVAINAKHYCVASRGVGDSGSRTNTSALGGVFEDNSLSRNEFYSLHNSRIIGLK